MFFIHVHPAKNTEWRELYESRIEQDIPCSIYDETMFNNDVIFFIHVHPAKNTEWRELYGSRIKQDIPF